MGLYCNRSAVDLPPPEQIVATDAPLPQPQSTIAPDVSVERETEGDEGGSGLLIGVIGAGGGLVVGGLGVFALYKVLGKKTASTGGGGGGGGSDSGDGPGHPSVVVGRPVTDPVAGAVAPPAGAAALDDKGGSAAAGTPLGPPSSSASKGN